MTLPTGPTMGERVAESRRRHAEALQMGGEPAVDRHRASGRLPVRERITLLLDEGSWFETGMLAQPERRTGKKVPGDGVVTGFGRMDGRTVGLIGIDATALAGTTAPVSMRKQRRVIEQAQRFGYPLVLLCDADGGRIPDIMGWRFRGLPRRVPFLPAVRRGQPRARGPSGRARGRPGRPDVGRARRPALRLRHAPGGLDDDLVERHTELVVRELAPVLAEEGEL